MQMIDAEVMIQRAAQRLPSRVPPRPQTAACTLKTAAYAQTSLGLTRTSLPFARTYSPF